MKKQGWLAACFFLGLFAQPHHRMRERLQSLRIAYLSEEMKLMPEEAQNFWPLYNAREAELQKARAAAREQLWRLEERRYTLSPEAFADSVSAIYLGLWQKEGEIRRSYHERLKKALPPEKLARFYLAELRLLRRALGETGPPHRE
ncbi:MAG: hypothetical protein N2253_06700 [Bacteroidia bacterium]|nr:hypothetical protein [Bacteroidia bacterium]MCX7764562.1 hypothetical protein [Bacteroidia bacterium]MDW8058226.1 hypothetical protein [Bacteroidia bacterium]